MSAKGKAKFRVGQVVFDEEMNEYVTIRTTAERLYNGQYHVFNPRCGEEYNTFVRRLTKRERGIR